MADLCASAPRDLDDIASLLAGVDCRVASYVEAAYQGLFGPFGWLAPTLTAALTIYVAIYAYQLIAGYGSLSVSTLARRFLAIGLVVAFASNWAAYQTVFVNLLAGGGEELAAMILRATAGGVRASSDVGLRLDALFSELARLASNWGARAPLDAVALSAGQEAAPVVQIGSAPSGLSASSATNMLWFSAIILALGSAGVIVVAKIALGFLLALGPLFIILALFPSTRGLFEGWLRAAAMNALAPMLALLASAGMLPIIEPIVVGIAEAQAIGEIDPEPVFVLAIASLIFGVLMAYSVMMTGKLAGAWRLPEVVATHANADPVGASQSPAGANPRIIEMLAAVGRESAAPPSTAEALRPRGAEMLVLAQGVQSALSTGERRVRAGYRGFGSGRTAVPGRAS